MKKPQLHFSKNRLLSLDALRGFNMFWIIGGEKVADALSRCHLPMIQILAAQLSHTAWNGFTFYDLIYPMFIFVTGVSTVYSLDHRKERGDKRYQILLHIFRRSLLLFLYGLYLSNAGLNLHGWLTNVRLMGVLQRIAICYCGAAILVLFVKRRYQVVIALIILLGYWLILKFGVVPGYGAGVWYPPEANFANYFDKLFLPGRKYYGTWDVEGLLSTFPALVTCQIGVFAGFWLKEDWKERKIRDTLSKKAFLLALIGIFMLELGVLWVFYLPINKMIWTSSFTLVTGGLSVIILALFYWLIDVKAFKKWAFPFIVIGLNSIFIYLLMNIIPWDRISKGVPSWIFQTFGEYGDLVFSLSTLVLGWDLLYWMYKRKIFIKI